MPARLISCVSELAHNLVKMDFDRLTSNFIRYVDEFVAAYDRGEYAQSGEQDTLLITFGLTGVGKVRE